MITTLESHNAFPIPKAIYAIHDRTLFNLSVLVQGPKGETGAVGEPGEPGHTPESAPPGEPGESPSGEDGVDGATGTFMLVVTWHP